jgi:hypothetical protein
MKKITLLLILLTVSFGYSQINITFDPAPLEGSWFPNESMTTADVVDATVDFATYGKVGRMITNAGGAPWQNAQLIMTDNKIDMTASTVITADVYSTTAIEMLCKVQQGGGNREVYASHAGSGWQSLSWDLSVNPNPAGTPTGDYGSLGFFPLYDSTASPDPWVGTNGSTINIEVWIDNIIAAAGAAVVETCTDGIKNQDETGVDCGGTCGGICPPTDAPAEKASTGTDLYAYSGLASTGESDLPGFSFQQFGSGSEITLNGNKVGRLQNLGFFGGGWTAIDVSTYTYVHLDYFVTSSTEFNFYLIDATAGIGGGNAAEPRYRFGGGTPDIALITGSWQSVFIPLQHFLDFDSGTFSYDLSDIAQYKFDGNGTVFFDNIYFSTSNTLGTKNFEIAGLNVYPNPARDSWTVKTQNINMSSIEVFDILGKNVLSLKPNASETTINGSSLKSGLYFARINTLNGSSSLKLIKN